MRFCSNCGKMISENAKFCSACGVQVFDENNLQHNSSQYYKNTNALTVDPNEIINSAFGKGIAACICSIFPVASIVAIVLGSKVLSMRNKAVTIAESAGQVLSGKRIAVKVLGMVGKWLGVGMTVFWALYILLLVLAFS